MDGKEALGVAGRLEPLHLLLPQHLSVPTTLQSCGMGWSVRKPFGRRVGRCISHCACGGLQRSSGARGDDARSDPAQHILHQGQKQCVILAHEAGVVAVGIVQQPTPRYPRLGFDAFEGARREGGYPLAQCLHW